MSSDTIFALATGAGRAAIAVIRLSGPCVSQMLEAIAGLTPQPRFAHYAGLRDPRSGEILDHGLVLFFPAGRSPTGEDYGELQIHGGRSVIDGFLTSLSQTPGLRRAEPGEFARRSFVRGKMDLSQVEGIADLVDAETALQRRQALQALSGGLRRRVEEWRDALIRASALVEAELDFSDEGDVLAPAEHLRPLLAPLMREMEELARQAPAAERLREGFLVLLLGPPNSGKSTLLNALAQRDVAIVSDIPGTTRDMIEVHLDIGGLPVTLVDTAGLRETADEIERLGVSRTRARIGEADLSLWLSEGGKEPPADEIAAGAGDCIRIATKADVRVPVGADLAISARTGLGMEALIADIRRRAEQRLGDGSGALLTRERHRILVEAAAACLRASLEQGKALEIVAEDLRGATRALGRIVGAVDVEDVLDAIFAQFCIGK
ncbi:tRNA uridine-5-carboxymethylaminomethyl(34) synthesis GTPase MnmE [Methylosinus sp. Sm6]|uniref:tRNA uridine-5-carboxymethylaminomethyl(34) synthesis GTPase MnmE n=1 Tax=Methylosinus sp. Sm6 TaxID=2866948 RepID=UPI001C99C61D|nr:tRNA uridine-5-carboxymethylaminomethyl(34) synthesis GTPase MnmE [Methylosinus sp. Sm6]MBY6241805.1 tRNA uridine-5-carboxymethylaminomethyl(34) synthesis GTPase MnmE [Methylosinus sp. Sm6]